MESKEKDIPVAFCLRCGAPLKPMQIAVRFDGQFVEFRKRFVGPMTFYLCDECSDAADQWMKDGIRGAVKRFEEPVVP